MKKNKTYPLAISAPLKRAVCRPLQAPLIDSERQSPVLSRREYYLKDEAGRKVALIVEEKTENGFTQNWFQIPKKEQRK